jgi:hypothetical protein
MPDFDDEQSPAISRTPLYPYGDPDPSTAGSPEDALTLAISSLADGWTGICQAGTASGPFGAAFAARLYGNRELIVAGASPMADILRTLLAGGASPGWGQHRCSTRARLSHRLVGRFCAAAEPTWET